MITSHRCSCSVHAVWLVPCLGLAWHVNRRVVYSRKHDQEFKNIFSWVWRSLRKGWLLPATLFRCHLALRCFVRVAELFQEVVESARKSSTVKCAIELIYVSNVHWFNPSLECHYRPSSITLFSSNTLTAPGKARQWNELLNQYELLTFIESIYPVNVTAGPQALLN